MQPKIRIGFVLNQRAAGWIGGVNYMTNLLRAIRMCPSLEAVVFSESRNVLNNFCEFSDLETHLTSLLDPKNYKFLARRFLTRGLGRDILFERFLIRHRIKVLSHGGLLGGRTSIPSIEWIPDFQHRHMPEFFCAEERLSRDATFARIAKRAHIVLLSSQTALNDFKACFPNAVANSRVLRFTSDVGSTLDDVAPRRHLEDAYGLTGPYFHLPNQFWIHKNHGVVLEAMQLARKHGRPMTVVATGHHNDYRHPDYFEKLMQRASTMGIVDDFRVLGLVPYRLLAALMVHSTAVINPSWFEGWSTTVEEAKSLGKRIILSDIPVHREQAPEHGTYFRPDDPRDLVAKMIAHLASFDPAAENSRQLIAKHKLPERFKSFGKVYEDIILSLVEQVG